MSVLGATMISAELSKAIQCVTFRMSVHAPCRCTTVLFAPVSAVLETSIIHAVTSRTELAGAFCAVDEGAPKQHM